MALLELTNVTRRFRQMRKIVTAVEEVNLAIAEKEIICLVGESGCGKTTTGKIAAGLLDPSGARFTLKAPLFRS